MISTSRIQSGFDVELMLGSGWFLTALRALNSKGLLLPGGPPSPFPPDAEVSVDDVQIIFPPDDRDLQLNMTIGNVPITVFLTLELSDDGSELTILNSVPGVDPTTIPFDVLGGLAAPPVVLKLQGDDEHDPAIAFLANLDLRASPQSEQPLPPGQHVERGTPLAFSFLPPGKDIVIGIGKDTFPRLANDIWHTNLREDDGSHPFPDEEDKKGSWISVNMRTESERVKITLKAKVPIDLFPDADITIDIELKPETVNGNVCFSVDVNTNVDTGLLGDLFAFIGGGVVGFLIGLIFGGPFIGLGIGAVGGVILLEIREAVQEGEVRRRVETSLNGEPVPSILACQNSVVVIAQPTGDDNLVGGFTNAIPKSIPISTDNPEPIFERTLLVTAVFDDFQADEFGLAFAGGTEVQERFQPVFAKLVDRQRNEAGLQSLIYRVGEEEIEVEIELPEVLLRIEEGELIPPFRLRQIPAEADIRRPEGRLPSVCLTAVAIRRKNTVVKEIQFSTGLDLKVEEAVALQDAGAINLRGLQLIYPKNANPYYRSFADGVKENNFEELPKF